MLGFPALQVLALCEAMVYPVVGWAFGYRTSPHSSQGQAGKVSLWNAGVDGIVDQRERGSGGGGLGCYKRVLPDPLTRGVYCWARMQTRTMFPLAKTRQAAVTV